MWGHQINYTVVQYTLRRLIFYNKRKDHNEKRKITKKKTKVKQYTSDLNCQSLAQ